MILRRTARSVFAFSFFLIASCAIGTGKTSARQGVSNPSETFSEADRPGAEALSLSTCPGDTRARKTPRAGIPSW